MSDEKWMMLSLIAHALTRVIMAKMYPPQLNSDAPAAQRTIYQSLALLSDEFTVVQGVKFADPQGNRPRQIDFLIIHPSLGLLVLEVSGGLVRVADSQWRSSDVYGSGDRVIANPYRQTQEDRVAFSRWLRTDSATSQFAASYNRHIEAAVALPDTDAGQSNLGLSASPRNTIDRSDLPNPEAPMRRLMDHAELNYQLPTVAIALLVGKLTQAPTVPSPPRPVAAPAVPAASASSFGGRTISLLTVFVALIVVGVLVSLLIGNTRKVNTTPVAALVPSPTITVRPVLVLDAALPTNTPASAIPTATPFVPPQALASPTVPLQLAIGADAVVSASDGLRVRKQPRSDADLVIKLAQGVKVHISGGPQQADGYTWWQVVGWPDDNGDSGWCAGEFLQPVARQ